jgi:hypothetical protein
LFKFKNMPRELDYPRRSFIQTLELANAVDFLGGNTSIENAAEKINQSAKGGGFAALFSAAVKHKLIEGKKGFVTNTDLFRSIKLAYTEDEKRNALRSAFLEPQVYKSIYEKFKNKELPVQMLDKILIREFNVADVIASRVSKYFLEGASYTELLNGNKLIEIENINTDPDEAGAIELSTLKVNPTQQIERRLTTVSNSYIDEYLVHIYGPGIESKITINDEDDFSILEAMIKKLKRKVQENKVIEFTKTQD